jgi:uncharacterized protein (DUF433 family)
MEDSGSGRPILAVMEPIHPRLAERAREPRYSVIDAASFIDRPTSTVRRWALGHVRRDREGRVIQDPPLIRIDGERDFLPLSFLNLLELRFLGSYRNRVPLPSIRRALDYAAEQLHEDRPLLTVDFKVHGRSLFLKFVEVGGDQYLVNASKRGQLAWPESVEELFQAVDYSEEENAAYRWWPLGRPIPVVIDTRLNGGRPITERSMVRTVAIAARRAEGLEPATIAGDVGADLDEVQAALRFEHVRVA